MRRAQGIAAAFALIACAAVFSVAAACGPLNKAIDQHSPDVGHHCTVPCPSGECYPFTTSCVGGAGVSRDAGGDR